MGLEKALISHTAQNEKKCSALNTADGSIIE